MAAPRSRLIQRPIPPDCELTRAEFEVLAAIVDGLSYKQIAHERGRSHSTIRTQIHNILTKLDVSESRQAVVYFMKKGWHVDSSSIEVDAEQGEVHMPMFGLVYLAVLDLHILNPTNASYCLLLEIAAEGVHGIRKPRSDESRNNFIDAVMRGMRGGGPGSGNGRGRQHNKGNKDFRIEGVPAS